MKKQFGNQTTQFRMSSPDFLERRKLHLLRFHQSLKLPYLKYLVILVAILCGLLSVYFSLAYDVSWHRFRLPVRFSSNSFVIQGSGAQTNSLQGLIRECDRIIAIGNVPVSRLSDKNFTSSLPDQIILVRTLEDNFDFAINSPLSEGQIVQLWSVRENNITLDLSNCLENTTFTSAYLEARISSCNACFTSFPQNKNEPAQIKLNLDEIRLHSGEFLSISVLALLALAFGGFGIGFFVLQPNRLITAIHALFFSMVGLTLVVHNSVYYHEGSLEKLLALLTFQLIPPLFLHFVLLFPDGKVLPRKTQSIVFLSYVFSIGLLVLELFGNLVSDEQNKVPAWEQASQKLRYLDFVVIFGAALVILGLKYYRSKAETKLRLRLAVFSLIIGSLPTFLVFLLNALFGLLQDWAEYKFALLLIPALAIPTGFGYAIIKNKLLGVDIRVRKIVVHSILITLVTLLYLILTPLITIFLPFWKDLNTNPVYQVLIIIAINAVCSRFLRLLTKLIDKAFAVDPLDYNGLSRAWSNRLVQTTELEQTFLRVVQQLPLDYHYKSVSLLLCHPEILEIHLKHLYQNHTLSQEKVLAGGLLVSLLGQANLVFPRSVTIPIAGPVNEFLEYNATKLNPLVLDFLKENDWVLLGANSVSANIEAEFTKLNLLEKPIVPLKLAGEFYGVLFFGEKTGEYTPPPDELDFLSSLGTQISASIHNAWLLAKAKAVGEREKQLRLISEARTRRDQQIRQKTLSEVADDLHGGPVQALYLLQQTLEQAAKDVALGRPVNAYDFNKQASSVREVIAKIRRTTTALRLYGVEKDFIEGIRRLVKDFELTFGANKLVFTTSSNAEMVDDLLEIPVKLALFRVIQEAINNALKHAKASRIEVSLEVDELEQPFAAVSSRQVFDGLKPVYLLEVRVADDGVGVGQEKLAKFNAEHWLDRDQFDRGEHCGIGIIKQQVEQFSEKYCSKINFYSAPGAGFEVAVAFYLPFEEAVKDEAEADNSLIYTAP